MPAIQSLLPQKATLAQKPNFWDQTWDSALGILRVAAPTMATILGGPLAGLAVQELSGVLLGKPDASPAEVAQAVISMSTDQTIAARAADQALKEKMAAANIELEKVYAEDRDSARKRQVDIKDYTPNYLALMLTVGFFSMLGLSVWRPFPADNAAFLNIMTGTLGTVWLMSMTFFFGTTASSAMKTAMLYNSTPTSTPTT